MELFKKIWSWIKGAGKKIAAVMVSVASALFIGKILSNKRAEREIFKKESKLYVRYRDKNYVKGEVPLIFFHFAGYDYSKLIKIKNY